VRIARFTGKGLKFKLDRLIVLKLLQAEITMRIGVLSARGPEAHPNQRLMASGRALGHPVALIHPRDCVAYLSGGAIRVRMKSAPDGLDVVLPRIGATIKDYALALVRNLELSGLKVINGFHSILLARNKFLTLQTLGEAGVPVPDSFWVSNMENFEQAVADLGGYPVVVKAPASRQGQGVVLVDSKVTAGFIMANLPVSTTGLLVQEFMPPETRRDIRAFVIGGELVAAVELRPRKGDFRSNIHQGGNGRRLTPGRDLTILSLSASRALGLEIAGIDMMIRDDGRIHVIETNYSPGFEGLEEITGIDIASRIIALVVKRDGEGPCASPS
jgi:ribosomal protein S6--L-glutamate ligase